DISPPTWTGTADDANVQFLSQGKDRWGHDLSFVPTWETTDPNGTIDASGVYTPGKAGTWVVRVRDAGGTVLGNATVFVSPGILVRLALTPPAAASRAGSQIAFFLTGFDSDGNEVGLSATEWSSTAGTFVSVTPVAALFRLPGVPGSLTVTARHGAVVTTAMVDVTVDGIPAISPPVPNQVHLEDSTWSLDLSNNAANQVDPTDTLATLKWYLTGKDASLYTVWGENFTGNHVLVFSGQPDAFGSNQVRLWLEDATGARTSQTLWVNLTGVDDPPRFTTIPTVPVKAGTPYTFDLEPYIVDVDTPPGGLTLTTDDPAHVSVAGLNLTLTYPTEDLGRRIYLRLAVSDGNSTARTVVIVDVTSNTPPHVRSPLPDLSLQEDEFRARAFPQSLATYFADDDGDDLFFSYGQRDVTVVIWNNSGFFQVDVRPNRDWSGAEKVTFRAEDRNHAFAEYSILVTVAPVNDPPELLWKSDVFVRFDTPYVLDLSPYIRDVDSPLAAVTLEASPTRFIVIRGLVATLLYPRFALGSNLTYDLPATFYVNDSDPGGSWRVYVHVSDNRPPILTRSLPDVRFDEDTLYTGYRLSDYFADPDSLAPLRFNFTGAHVQGDIQTDTRIVFHTAAPNWFGQETVFIKANDSQGAFVIAPVVVRVSPVDDGPVLRQIEDRDLTGARTGVIDLRGYVTDVDDALENLTFTSNSPYASVYGYILLLDVPAGVDFHSVTVTVSDGHLSDSSTFQLILYRPTIWTQAFWPWSGIGAAVGGVLLFLVWALFLRFPHTLEDVFIIGREGRLIMHNTRRLRADRDEDILAGMLTAIMLFVRDSFREEKEDLKQFEFGDRKVLVERGIHCFIAAIFGGAAPPWARKDVAQFLKEIETKVGDRIATWSGDRDDVLDLKGMTEDFVRRRRYRRNGGSWPFRARAS
ncbi:MAG TPA: hypothetical protein VK723_02770, partial [Thermoplasmata archaeon]|nr:hypothetical protein [Thermoplasmata archaeon]